MRSKLLTKNNVSHGQNSILCKTILLVKFRAIICLSFNLSAFFFLFIKIKFGTDRTMTTHMNSQNNHFFKCHLMSFPM